MQEVYCHLSLKYYVQEKVLLPEQDRFMEAVESELMSLHEGNISRYRLRLSEYETWKKI